MTPFGPKTHDDGGRTDMFQVDTDRKSREEGRRQPQRCRGDTEPAAAAFARCRGLTWLSAVCGPCRAARSRHFGPGRLRTRADPYSPCFCLARPLGGRRDVTNRAWAGGTPGSSRTIICETRRVDVAGSAPSNVANK